MGEVRGDDGGAAGLSALEPLLDPEETAKILNLSPSWLAKARGKTGEGPEFVKIGRAVRYSESSIRKFILQRTRVKTGGE